MPNRHEAGDADSSFIVASLKSRQGKFYCAVCGSSDIQVMYNPQTYVLRIVCMTCGNFWSVNCAPLEEQHGG